MNLYIYIDNTYYEVSGKITDENRNIINKKITYKIIDKLYKNKNYFVYLNKYSPVCKKLKLIKFAIIYNVDTVLSKKILTPSSSLT